MKSLLQQRLVRLIPAPPPADGTAASGAQQIVEVVEPEGETKKLSLEERFRLAFRETSLSLQRLLTSQIDALPPEQQQALRTGSALGESFEGTTVRAIHKAIPELNARTVDEALRHLKSGKTLEFSSSAGGLGGTYAFHSSLLRDVVYFNMTFEQRRKLLAAR